MTIVNLEKMMLSLLQYRYTFNYLQLLFIILVNYNTILITLITNTLHAAVIYNSRFLYNNINSILLKLV